MDSKRPIYKSIVFSIMVLFLLYSALGSFAVPYYIEQEVSKFTKKLLNSNIKFTNINFNPYAISADLSKVTLNDFATLEDSVLQPKIIIPKLTVNNTHVDLSKKTLYIQAINTSVIELWLNFTEDYIAISTFAKSTTNDDPFNKKQDAWVIEIKQIDFLAGN